MFRLITGVISRIAKFYDYPAFSGIGTSGQLPELPDFEVDLLETDQEWNGILKRYEKKSQDLFQRIYPIHCLTFSIYFLNSFENSSKFCYKSQYSPPPEENRRFIFARYC